MIVIFFLAVSVLNKKEQVIKTKNSLYELNPLEKKVINLLQKDFGFDEKPFEKLAQLLGLEEDKLIEIIINLKDQGFISRIGPFFNMDRTSGYVSLVAMKVDDNRFEEVAALVNSYVEVAHNYKRDNDFNMWFVIAAQSFEEARAVLSEIEEKTGLKTFNLPKLQEFSLDLYLEV